jgi:hypothetical protein
MGYDLTLVLPATRRNGTRAEATLAALVAEIPAARGWEPRLAFTAPDEEDCVVVEELLEEGADEAEAFNAFCHDRDVKPRNALADAAVCAEFVDLQWGSRLVTVTLPHREPEAAFAELVAFASRHQLALHDPQEGADVDVANPGRLPRRY